MPSKAAMAAPDWSLHDPTSALGPRGSSESNRSFHLRDHLESPQLAREAFDSCPASPRASNAPQLDYRCVQRKSSSANLAATRPRYTEAAAHWPDDPWTPSLILPRLVQSACDQNIPPLYSHNRPRTPHRQTYAASPSLSSSVDTLQSSPFQTPIHPGSLRAEYQKQEDWNFAEPLRTKRKFDSVKRAKRLPRQTDGLDSRSSSRGVLWEVYADIFEVGVDVRQAVEHAELKKAKSVRFETVTAEGTSSTESPSKGAIRTRGEQSTSSISLSRINWPLPDSHDDRRGNFDHIDTFTPPGTPATLLYRGASFDVLNPHASLILGPQNLETPAEIDGLLESYFEDHDIMQDNTDQCDTSPHAPSENSRRVLYESADDARRNILRIQKQNKPQVTPPPKAMVTDVSGRKSERPFSDPFDLTLSESGSRNAIMNIDDAARKEPLGLGITDFGETHATSEQITDPTIKDILADYEYTRVPLSQLDTKFEEMEAATSPSIERGRGDKSQQLSYDSSYGLISPLQTPVTSHREPHNSRLHGPTALPTPPQPVYTGGLRSVGGTHSWTGRSDLPTTEQSYGNTNQLLNITPEDSHPPPAVLPCCDSATCVNATHIHADGPIEIYEDPDGEIPATPTVQEFFDDDDKENIPPPDYDPEAASASMHGGMNFRFPDADDDFEDDGDLARVMPRSSSFYPDDGESEWVTEYGVSQQDLRRNLRFSAMSAESYANTSFVNSRHRFSFTPPAEKAPLSPVEDNPSDLSHHFQLYSDSLKAIAGADTVANERRMAIEARISQLESKIAGEQIASSYAGSPKIDLPARRAELAELDRLRGLMSSTSRPLIFKASESLDTIKANAQNKLQKAKTFVRPPFQPKLNFSRSATLGRQEAAFNSASDTRGLLASPDSLSPYTNFGYSESTGTFMTIRQDSPVNARGPATNLWSPFDKDPTNRAINAKSPIGKKPKIVDIELGLMNSKSQRSHRAAVGSQFEARDLHLVKSKRLTDAQLDARSADWTMAPSQVTGRPIGRGTDWSSSSDHPMLLKPESEMDRAARREQKCISKRFVYGCAAFPPLTLLFGLGFFDKRVARLTSGRVKEACAKEKRNALMVFLPLGIIFWAVLVLAIFLMVTITKGRGQGEGSPF